MARQHAFGQRRNGFERRTQLVGHAGYQLPRGRQFLAAEELFPDGLLLHQLERSRDLVAQMLCGALLVGAEVVDTVGVDFQNAQQLILGKQRNEHDRARQVRIPATFEERAAAGIRNAQKCAVPEARGRRHGQGAGRSIHGNRKRFRLLRTGHALQSLRTPVEDVKARPFHSQHFGQHRADLLGDLTGGVGGDDFLAQAMERLHHLAEGGCLAPALPQKDQPG